MKKESRFRIYTDKDADLRFLKEKIIAIVGYGNQGRAQSLNLRDSGLDIIIGLPQKSESKRKAQKDGFKVYSTEQAVKSGDLISVLAPDHLHSKIYQKQIKPYLCPGKTLLFASGFSVHFKLVDPPDFVDVVMVAPHAPGTVTRELFLQGKGVPCFFAVKQDITGEAKRKALAYAKGIGCTKAGAFETTFEHEAIGDLFGEQAVLCGGLSELIRAGFEVLVQAGLPPENAYLECVHQLDHIVNTIKAHGIAGMFDRISQTAEFGSYLSGKKVITPKTKLQMEKVLRQIQDGTFVKRWKRECQRGLKTYLRMKREAKEHPIEKAGKRIRRLLK